MEKKKKNEISQIEECISNGIGQHIRRSIYRRVEERLAEVTVLQCIRLPLKRR